MKVHISDKVIAYLTLLSGLSISAVAVWYSVAGLVSIFAAAAIPIMIMGIALEVSKLVATVWLKMNWKRAPVLIRTYLLSAIVILMLITSMGIFGFLSKAHLDQAVPTGDVADKVALIDEKIKTERDNIDAARKALKQMDESVDQTMARSTDEKGADKAAALRRGQQRERTNLQNDIAKAQKHIAALNEERAPVAKDLRKIEAEVGPIKYIAALLYGDNPDTNLLEKAVRWVIIVIVMVFDPLAVILLIASQISFQWFRQSDDEDNEQGVKDFFARGKDIAQRLDKEAALVEEPKKPEEEIDKHAYLKTPWVWKVPGVESVGPIVADNIPVGLKDPSDSEKVPVKNYDAEEYYDYIDDGEGEPDKPKYESDDGPLTKEQVEQIQALANKDLPTGKTITKDSLFPEETGLDEWNKMIEEAEKAVDAEKEQEENQILDEAPESEKAAMKAWKHDNPEGSLKQQRRLLERGIIKNLPWIEYIKAQPDFVEEPVKESKKILLSDVWNQPTPEDESKKKDNIVDGMGGRTSSEEEQRDIGYVQNAEQGEQTLWQRIKKGI